MAAKRTQSSTKAQPAGKRSGQAVAVRDRILLAGKRLFAAHGFENTATAMIVKEAGTSESQLFKYFHDKEGLLEAVFQDGWSKMSFVMTASEIAKDPREQLHMIFELSLRALQQDPELRDLMLFEGRRIRKVGGKLLVTDGYTQFSGYIDRLLSQLACRKKLVPGVSPVMARTILVGCFESMLRELVLTERNRGEVAFAPDEMRSAFEIMLRCFVPTD